MEFKMPVEDQTALISSRRHYMIIRSAMQSGDKITVGNRQLRLLHAGLEIPLTIEQCDRILSEQP